MESYLIYIGKSALAAGAFYLVYLVLFQNQKQFVFNRIYLPVSFVLSFAIPLITLTSIRYIEPTEPVNFDFNSFAYLPEPTKIIQPQFVYQWYHYLIGIYILGVTGFLFYLLLGHIKASKIIRYSRLKQLFGTQVNITPKDVHPFSFFNKIVLSEKTLHNPNLKMIVCHEKIHVKEKHTLDILFAEILFLFQWFNPFAWLIKDAIKNNLEYKTDDQVIQQNNAEAYQLAMVGLADKKGVAPFLTALNGSQLKNRIIMMKKKTKNKYAFVKQLVVLPLLAVLIMGLSNREVKTEIIKNEIPSSEKIIKANVAEKNSDIIILQVDPENPPLYIVNKTEVQNLDLLDPENITTIAVLKDAAAFYVGSRVGNIDKSKNGAVVITTKIRNTIDESDMTYMVNGKKYNGSINKISVENHNREPILIHNSVKEDFGTREKEGVLIDTKTTEFKNKEAWLKIEELKSLKNPPLFIVDGKVWKNLDNLKQKDIHSVSVLKGESATKIYKEKGKYGVLIITTKEKAKQEKKGLGESLIIYDGKNYSGDLSKISPTNIHSMQVIKNENTTFKYGSTQKNAAVIISSEANAGNPPLLVIDGKVSEKKMMDLDNEAIASFTVLEKKEANTRYGNKAKNGVIEIETNKFYIPPYKALSNVTVKGKVTDENGKPISGASVIIKGTTSGTVTDQSGNYELILEDGNSTLMFLMVGFEKKEVLVGNKTGINVKLTPDKKDDVITITTTSSSKIVAEQIKKYGGEIFYKVEEMPQFPGGDKALKKYIENSTKYPEIALKNGIQGKVYVSFIIDKDGKVNDPQIARGVDPVLDKEAMRVVSSLPKFKPGKQRGKVVNTSYTVPVEFIPTFEHIQKYNKVGLDGKPLNKQYKHSIRGKVTDKQGAALPGVSVIIKGINAGTVTDKGGYYILKYDSAIETIIFVVNGQTKKEIKVDGKTLLNVVLESESDPKSSETKVAGESEHSSVGIQHKSSNSNFDVNPPLFIIDGKISDKNGMENLDPNTINDITVLKDAEAIVKYGAQATNGVILITKKDYNGTRKGELPVVLNGKMTQLTLNEVDRDLIKNIKRIEPEEAVKKYGEKGKNGVFEITSRKVHRERIEVKSSEELAKENGKITSELELRKFIAKEIKYPKEVADAGVSGTVTIIASIDKKGNLSVKDKPSYPDVRIDEVVVTAYAPKQEIENTEETNKALYNNLKKEAKRVVKSSPNIQIDEFKGKSVGIIVKFVLQD